MPHKILMTYHDSRAFRAGLRAGGFKIASQVVRVLCCSSLRRCGRPMPSGGEALQSTFPIKRSKDYEGGNERTRKGEKEVEEEERGGEGLKHCAGWMINEWKKFLNGRNFRNRTSAGSETTSGVTKPFQYMGNKGDSEGPRHNLPRDPYRDRNRP